jgi:hypothetical protein
MPIRQEERSRKPAMCLCHRKHPPNSGCDPGFGSAPVHEQVSGTVSASRVGPGWESEVGSGCELRIEPETADGICRGQGLAG